MEATIQPKPKSFILYLFVWAGVFVHSTFSQSIVSDNTEKQQKWWSDPEQVIQDSSWHFPVFNTVLAKNSQGLFVFGNTISNPGVADVEEYYNSLYDIQEPLIAVGPDGRRIPLPEGEYSFAYPRAAADISGGIHLLWAEYDPEISEDQWPVFTQIYSSRYKNGDWSVPRMIYQAVSIRWEPESTSTFFLDQSNHLHFMFEANKTERTGKGIVHLYMDGEGWHEAYWIGPRAVCAYMDLAVASTGRLLMVCVGPAHDKPNDRNSVFFTFSDDHGKTWEEATLVSLSGSNQATKPRILTSDDGTIHLLWGKNLKKGLFPQTVWQSSSKDGGKTWNKPVDLNLGPYPEPYDAIIDSTGNLHLVYQKEKIDKTNQMSELEVYYTKWDGQQWSTPRPISSEFNLKILPNNNLLIMNEYLYLTAIQFRPVNSYPWLNPEYSVYLRKQLFK